jgi:hypothetical protein
MSRDATAHNLNLPNAKPLRTNARCVVREEIHDFDTMPIKMPTHAGFNLKNQASESRAFKIVNFMSTGKGSLTPVEYQGNRTSAVCLLQ